MSRESQTMAVDSSTKKPGEEAKISLGVTITIVVLYVLSGCSQPLMMTLLRRVGVADPTCQLYMLFYYFGPAAAIFTIPTCGNNTTRGGTNWPPLKTISKACCIALFDIVAQTMNYTGASLAGPTIFAIVYSSVTIWAALYSQLFLGRIMDSWQWIGVIGVFGGLVSTAADSLTLGSGVLHGLVLVTIGSSMHGLFYVMSEAVMTLGTEQLSVQQNCAVQGLTASFSFLLWQALYTAPRFEEKIWEPMEDAGTSMLLGLSLLVLFGFISFVHSMTFYHVLCHLPGGSTSAGVFKGLQAVLVFVLTDWVYCGRIGGEEMCFTRSKFVSLFAVGGGVVWYGISTNRRETKGPKASVIGYERIDDADGLEIEAI
jgi:drug/metabolite transporter (DMT)-like permease